MQPHLGTCSQENRPSNARDAEMWRVHVIVNPAAGSGQPVLQTLHRIFRPAGVDWELSVTKKAGDATRHAQAALDAGADVVAAYGGDGTIKEVATALAGSNVPLGILPGGTGNSVATELGIPRDLARAAHLVAGGSHHLRALDLGEAGEQIFAFAVQMGFLAKIALSIDTPVKERWGPWSYPLHGLQHLDAVERARYHLRLDGEEVEEEGVFCAVLNASSVGVAALSPLSHVAMDDGLLDVILLRHINLAALDEVILGILRGESHNQEMLHWQARTIAIEAEPPQPFALDGEAGGETPVTIRIRPKAVTVIVSGEPAQRVERTSDA